jgi:hypothetical protein
MQRSVPSARGQHIPNRSARRAVDETLARGESFRNIKFVARHALARQVVLAPTVIAASPDADIACVLDQQSWPSDRHQPRASSSRVFSGRRQR